VSVEYGIDRLTLVNTGMSAKAIDKLYRSLFVTTIGFNKTVNEVVD